MYSEKNVLMNNILFFITFRLKLQTVRLNNVSDVNGRVKQAFAIVNTNIIVIFNITIL